ncbi:hypothetical protein [Streptomyces sp. NPDC003710]
MTRTFSLSADALPATFAVDGYGSCTASTTDLDVEPGTDDS